MQSASVTRRDRQRGRRIVMKGFTSCKWLFANSHSLTVNRPCSDERQSERKRERNIVEKVPTDDRAAAAAAATVQCNIVDVTVYLRISLRRCEWHLNVTRYRAASAHCAHSYGAWASKQPSGSRVRSCLVPSLIRRPLLAAYKKAISQGDKHLARARATLVCSWIKLH
jgi:hypothetical protein